MILLNMIEYKQQLFVSEYTLPTGEIIYKDVDDPEKIGFDKLVGLEGHDLTITFPNGHSRKGILVDASEDCINVKWDDEQEE